MRTRAVAAYAVAAHGVGFESVGYDLVPCWRVQGLKAFSAAAASGAPTNLQSVVDAAHLLHRSLLDIEIATNEQIEVPHAVLCATSWSLATSTAPLCVRVWSVLRRKCLRFSRRH